MTYELLHQLIYIFSSYSVLTIAVAGDYLRRRLPLYLLRGWVFLDATRFCSATRRCSPETRPARMSAWADTYACLTSLLCFLRLLRILAVANVELRLLFIYRWAGVKASPSLGSGDKGELGRLLNKHLYFWEYCWYFFLRERHVAHGSQKC